ncbi:hypothetical protein IFT84_20655 [Rhizobium sp. CFBP 8762]|uniref:hypothetical protein n=1 Tax=Rhizobium sp. CFBP 8762 TaxID=2775279 RepID=UPI00178113C9|nr:hypothetical protein [Rhizobium sp. CFBP 8762]MBD8556924.1 hypothetical protein [Rhizobium sp. CFBP 8762]
MTIVRAGNLTRYIGGQPLGVGSVRTRVDPVSGLPVVDIGIGSGLGLRVQGGVAPAATIAGLDLDFANGRYAFNGPYVADISALPGWAFARNSQATAQTEAREVRTFGVNVPAITDRGLLIQEASGGRDADLASIGGLLALLIAPFVMFGEWTVGTVPVGSTALLTQLKGPTLGIDPARVKISYPGVADIVTIQGALAASTRNRMAGRFKPGDYAVSINGAIAKSTSTRAVSAIERMDIGKQARFLNGYIRRLRIIPGDMTDAQLRDLTT